MELKEIGHALREYRTKQGLTLRQFCYANRLDAVTVSRLERGCLGVLTDAELLTKLPALPPHHNDGTALTTDELDNLVETIRMA